VNGAGGGLQALDGKLWVLDREITDNIAADTSGALDIGNHGVTIKHSKFSGNRAPFAVVGYFYGDGASTIGASTFSKNRTSAGSLFVSRSTFSGNFAGTDGAGFSARNGDVKMVNVTIANNRARGFGGGLWASTPTTLNSVTIVRNVSDSDQAGSEAGGGIYVNPGFSIRVKVRNRSSP
jgi:hypothetical protein